MHAGISSKSGLKKLHILSVSLYVCVCRGVIIYVYMPTAKGLMFYYSFFVNVVLAPESREVNTYNLCFSLTPSCVFHFISAGENKHTNPEFDLFQQ